MEQLNGSHLTFTAWNYGSLFLSGFAPGLCHRPFLLVPPCTCLQLSLQAVSGVPRGQRVHLHKDEVLSGPQACPTLPLLPALWVLSVPHQLKAHYCWQAASRGQAPSLHTPSGKVLSCKFYKLPYSLLTATFIWEHDLNLLVFLSLNKEQQQTTIYNLAKLKGKAKKYN